MNESRRRESSPGALQFRLPGTGAVVQTIQALGTRVGGENTVLIVNRQPTRIDEGGSQRAVVLCLIRAAHIVEAVEPIAIKIGNVDAICRIQGDIKGPAERRAGPAVVRHLPGSAHIVIPVQTIEARRENIDPPRGIGGDALRIGPAVAELDLICTAHIIETIEPREHIIGHINAIVAIEVHCPQPCEGRPC